MKYIPFHDLVVVQRLDKKIENKSGIFLPEDRKLMLGRFKVLEVGPEIEHLEKGMIVLAEEVFEKISNIDPNIVLINQKFIHCEEVNDVN